MSGAHQSVFMNQRSFGPPPGQQEYTTGGTYTFIVPAGVESISSVVVSSGGVGKTTQAGGPGGNLRYIPSLAVTPGESLTVVVGPSSTTAGAFTQNSTIARGGTILLSSVSSTSGSIGGGNGGNGGAAYSTTGSFGTVKNGGGGGGAGGYGGNGGAGGITGGNGAGGGAGGGATSTRPAQNFATFSGSTYGAGGGGVGILGEGTSGLGGAASAGSPANGGKGGSGGTDGTGSGPGGAYGGGAPGGFNRTSNPTVTFYKACGSGAVRIIWGADRAYPSTNTGNV